MNGTSKKQRKETILDAGEKINKLLTLNRTFKLDIKFIHTIINQINLIVRHEELHDVRIGAAFRRTRRRKFTIR